MKVTVDRRVCAGLVALGVLLLGGCGGAPAAAPPPAPKSTAPQAAAAGGSAGTPAGSPAAGAVKTLLVASPALSPDFSYVNIAQDMGYFKPYGFQLRLESMKPPTAIAALQTGKIAFTTVVGSSINAALRGLPVRVIFVAQDYPDWLLVGAKGLKSVQQLRGKTIGGNVTPTDTVTVTTEQVMTDNGLPPGSYRLRLLGQSSPAVHLAALQSGAVAATMLDLQIGLKAQAQGFPVLARFWPDVKLPNDGLVTSLSEIQQHPATVEHVLAGLTKALALLRQHPNTVVPNVATDFHMQPAEAKTMLNLITSVWTTDGLPSSTSLQAQLRFVQQELKLKTLPQAGQAYDLSLQQKVVAQGAQGA